MAVSGICSGVPEKKFWEHRGKVVPESRTALKSRISGAGKGKPAANLGSTLPGPLSQPSMRGVFETDSYSPNHKIPIAAI